MKTELMEAMAAGVFVEFRDARGNTLGQAVYTDWRGQPLPAVGDTVRSIVNGTAGKHPRRLYGSVVSRQFDVQHDQRGEPCVWVLIVVEAGAAPAARAQIRRRAAQFSEN